MSLETTAIKVFLSPTPQSSLFPFAADISPFLFLTTALFSVTIPFICIQQSIPFCDWTACQCLAVLQVIHSPAEGHLSCFQFLCLRNNVTINIQIQIFKWTCFHGKVWLFINWHIFTDLDEGLLQWMSPIPILLSSHAASAILLKLE